SLILQAEVASERHADQQRRCRQVGSASKIDRRRQWKFLGEFSRKGWVQRRQRREADSQDIADRHHGMDRGASSLDLWIKETSMPVGGREKRGSWKQRRDVMRKPGGRQGKKDEDSQDPGGGEPGQLD